MTSEQYQQFLDMQRTIEELVAWKNSKDAQQITNPLDNASQQIINQDVPIFRRIKAKTVTASGVINFEINGKEYNILYE